MKLKICNRIITPEIPDIRYIDWARGNPYVFRNEDYYELKNTPVLFARKFSINVDSDIIEKIYEDLLQEKETVINEE